MKTKYLIPMVITLNACSPADYADLPGVPKNGGTLAFSEINGVDFGEVILGENKVKTLTITNSGKKKISGFNFSIGQVESLQVLENTCGNVIESGVTCFVKFSYNPQRSTSLLTNYSVGYDENGVKKNKTFSLKAEAVTQANLSFSQNTLNFGDVVVNGVKRISLLVSNSGGATAEVTTPNLLGDKLSFVGGQFPGSGGTCSLKIKGNTTCILLLESNPSENRAYSGALDLTYFDGKLQKTTTVVQIASVGKLPANLVNLNPSVLFDQTVVGSSVVKTVSVRNDGETPAVINTVTASGDGLSIDLLAQVSPAKCGSEILPGQTCSLAVKHTPLTAIQNFGVLAVSYNNGVDNLALTSDLQASSITPASVRLVDSSPVLFPVSTIGIKVLKEVTFENSGQKAADLFSISSLVPGYSYEGGQFPGIGGTCSSLIAGNSTCKIVFSHTASAVGQDVKTLNFSYNNGLTLLTKQFIVSAEATAEASLVFSSGASIDSGRGALGSQKTINIELRNMGQLSATGVSLVQTNNVGTDSEASFPLNLAECLSIAPGGVCSVPMVISHNQLGNIQTKLSVSYFGSNNVEKLNQIVVLSTVVQPAILNLAEGSVFDFGTVSVGEPSERVFTLTNDGGEPAASIVLSKESPSLEIINSTCQLILFAGDSCSFSVKFSPQTEGEILNSNVLISYHDGVSDTSASLSLSGVGGVPKLGDLQFSVNGPHTFGEVSINQTSSLVVDVTNIGTGKATGLTFSQINLPFAKVPTKGNLPECGPILLVGESCSFTVDFSPLVMGIYSQDLVVSYHNGLSTIPLTISLSGVGTFPSGTVDETFGTGGLVEWSVPGSVGSYLTGAKVLSNGKIIVGGSAFVPEDFLLSVRFNSDGTPDTTFGNQNGYFIDDNFGLGALSYKSIDSLDGGLFHFGTSDRGFSTSKMTVNGTMAANFGLSGHSQRPRVLRPDYAYSGKVLPDGKILAVGTRNEDAYIERMLPNGQLDLSFNGTGSQVIDVDLNLDELRFVDIQSSGKYVFGGGSMIGASGMNGTLFRVNSDGTLDDTFGSQGRVVVNAMGIGEKYITDALVLPDDKILALVLAQNNALGFELAEFEMYIARFTPDGLYDETFNNGAGFVHLTNWGNSGLISDFRMLRQPDGKVLIAGNKNNGFGYNLAVMRLKQDLSIDIAFGNLGEYVVPNSESFSDHSVALALQPNGEIILGGKKTVGFNIDAVILTRIHK